MTLDEHEGSASAWQKCYESERDETARLRVEIEELRKALKPFAEAHEAHYPADSITLHDIRMAHEALQTKDSDDIAARAAS